MFAVCASNVEGCFERSVRKYEQYRFNESKNIARRIRANCNYSEGQFFIVISLSGVGT